MKSIEKIIKEIVLKEKDSGSVSIDDSHFFAVLLEKGNNRKLWNFVFLFVVLIICTTILISSFVFLINDVLLFQNTPKINQAGAIIPERSCKRENAIFLFSSAQRWANTGIQLNEGDKIKISYSGGFHSDIAGLKKSTESNDTLRYKWISFPNKKGSQPYGLLFDSIRGGYFGSLLYVIAGESFVDYFSQNRELFYQDNIGEVLVVIDIKRHISLLSKHIDWYRWTEDKINYALDYDECQYQFINIAVRIFLTIFYFIVSIFVLFLKMWYVTIIILFILIIIYIKKVIKLFHKLKKIKK